MARYIVEPYYHVEIGHVHLVSRVHQGWTRTVCVQDISAFRHSEIRSIYRRELMRK